MRLLPILLFAALPLTACAPASDTAATSAPTAPPPSTAQSDVSPPSPSPTEAAGTPVGTPAPSVPTPADARATLIGAIRDGNRPPPALRICAHPIAGGAPTCIASAAGSTDYRLEVAPGRYHVMGWVQAGELALIAHATQIRCIAAPCPPDELIEVDVAVGEQKAGIDLAAGYADVPEGWPTRP